MDTVTYPDPKVREIAAEFVCIRVDFDKNPEIAKKYGVQPLADLRLLGLDGKEAAKLVGFSSAARLTKACRAELDRLAGKPTAGDETISSTKAENVSFTEAAVEAAVHRGIAYLRGAFADGASAGPIVGLKEQVLFALSSCNLDSKDEEVAQLRRSVVGEPLSGTYQAAFRALALSRLDPAASRQEIEACAKFLVASQLANGQWSYGDAAQAQAQSSLGDNSNSAYALLGLAACRKAGVEVPATTFERAETWWRSSQRPDGGWGYRTDREAESYASMTENGIGSLLLCRSLIAHDRNPDPALDRAQSWLSAHLSVAENTGSAYQQGRLLYHLYALERVGSLLGVDRIGDHDWYAEGATSLLRTQNGDGSWDDGADTPFPNTCFALLFLKRSSGSLR